MAYRSVVTKEKVDAVIRFANEKTLHGVSKLALRGGASPPRLALNG